MIRPTLRGVVMLLASAGCTGAAIVNVNLTTALIASAMLSVAASSFVLAFFSIHRISIKRMPNRDGNCGANVYLPFVITNESWQWRQGIVVREQLDFTEKYPYFYEPVEALAPHESRLVRRPIPAIKRGFYPLKRLALIGGDPGGFFCRVRKFNLPGEIMIKPQICNLGQGLKLQRRQAAMSVNGRPLGVSGLGQEFFGVREYSHYDEMRFIHWKASARHGQLMVKEFEANSISHIYIIIDSEKKQLGYDFFENNFEFLIKTAASIVSQLASMHCRLTFVCASNDDIIKFHGEAVSVSDDILDTLTVMRPGKIPISELVDSELDRFAYNSIFYCLSMSEPENLSEKFEILIGRGVETRWIYAPRKLFPIKEQGKPAKIKNADIDIISSGAVIPDIAQQNTDIFKLLVHE